MAGFICLVATFLTNIEEYSGSIVSNPELSDTKILERLRFRERLRQSGVIDPERESQGSNAFGYSLL